MLTKVGKAKPGDLLTPEEEIKDPFVLESLGLRDEYSESDSNFVIRRRCAIHGSVAEGPGASLRQRR
jgi:predicted nuclease of restriction endonuclease-like (RecB) superfamily